MLEWAANHLLPGRFQFIATGEMIPIGDHARHWLVPRWTAVDDLA